MTTSTKSQQPPGRPTSAVYLRRSDLSPQDFSDLQAFMRMQRDYFGVPDDQPVYPPLPKTADRKADTPRVATGRNGADHPWRGAR